MTQTMLLGSVNFIFGYLRFACSSYATSKLPISFTETTVVTVKFSIIMVSSLDYDVTIDAAFCLSCRQKCKFAKIKFAKSLRFAPSHIISLSSWPYHFILACYGSVIAILQVPSGIVLCDMIFEVPRVRISPSLPAMVTRHQSKLMGVQ